MSFDDDCLQLSGFADQLEGYLQVDHIFVPGSFVVGFEAPFELGKTAFLAMWFIRMRGELKNDSDGPIPVLLNVWAGDFAGDSLLSIVLSFVSELEQMQSAPASDLSALKKVAKQVAWFGVGYDRRYTQAF
ncbi:hypothetical protein CA13_08680 [Planctomycetes bacterium CA13]|uniref:Uncharacterized protein n=1 Tax=Novipirellula herctigrandis TaxID=2527986 RepID=A0A5C5YY30_9BACT|nr:hypothetical protein CA13_08680 [Planctomycetes bacterium CA13]